MYEDIWKKELVMLNVRIPPVNSVVGDFYQALVFSILKGGIFIQYNSVFMCLHQYRIIFLKCLINKKWNAIFLLSVSPPRWLKIILDNVHFRPKRKYNYFKLFNSISRHLWYRANCEQFLINFWLKIKSICKISYYVKKRA